MTTLAQQPEIRSADRLSLTVFFAVVFHAIIILGVGFDFHKLLKSNPTQRLEVTLVNKRSETPPEEADYLAQAQHRGSGNTKEKVQATAPSDRPMAALNEKQGSSTEKRVTTSKPSRQREKQRQLLTQEKSNKKIAKTTAQKPLPQNKPSAQELITRSMEVASLDAELKHQRQAYAKRPRVKYISASTKEFKYATYMEAWRAKVERIGRLNYPEEAKRRSLYGNLLLDVAISPDGTVKDIIVRRSSGIKLLDDAAVRIVRLASPYAPLPPHILEETNELHIMRTWIFRKGNKLSTK